MSKKRNNLQGKNLPEYNNTKVFIKVAQRVKEERLRREGRKKLRFGEWNEIQKLVKERQLADKFYDIDFRNVKTKDVDEFIDIKVLEPTQIDCGNPFNLDLAGLKDVDWFSIDNTITSLPDNIKIKVNMGGLGTTPVTMKAFYVFDMIRDGFEQMRELENNESGRLSFTTEVIKIDPNKPDDDLCNLYVEFILQQDGVSVSASGDAVDVDFDKLEITDEVIEARKRAEKLRKAKKKKVGKKPKKKKDKKDDKKPDSAVKIAQLKMYRDMLAKGEITFEQFEKLMKSFKKGGIV